MGTGRNRGFRADSRLGTQWQRSDLSPVATFGLPLQHQAVILASMKQTEAVDIIYSLLPKMKQAAPEEVMEKYAASRGLSAAQLERLGHVFNTATTLATLEKDRNASPTLVNVPQMVDRFVRTTGSSKRASFFEEEPPAPLPDTEDKPQEVPNVWADETTPLPDIPKEASDKAPQRRRVFEHALVLSERAVEEELEAVSKYAATLHKVAKQLAKEEDCELKLATLKADIAGLNSEAESEIICSKLAGMLSELGVPIQNNALRSAPPVVLHRDRTGFHPQVMEACEHLKVAIDTHASLLEALQLANDMASQLSGDWQVHHKAAKCANRLMTLTEIGGILGKSAADPADKPESKGVEPSNILQLIEAQQKDQFGELYAPTDFLVPAAKRTGAGLGELTGNVLDVYSNKLPGQLGMFSRAGALGKALEDTRSSNQAKARTKGDSRRQIEQDAIAAATLKRVIITDDILSTKDPERVYEAFNSIRNAAPEVAADPSMLRLLLRQALETQGVDIDTASVARKYQTANRTAPREENRN